MRVSFTLAGEPRGKGRPRFSSIRTENSSAPVMTRAYTPAKTRHYEAALHYAASEAMKHHGFKPFEGPLRITMVAVFAIPASWSNRKRQAAMSGSIRPTKKPDADNLLKCCDALNGVVFRDDAQIVHASVAKWFGPVPQLEIEVVELDAAALRAQAAASHQELLL